MSDFDKEAEREKLREKYERDVAKRETTQRMSDLLLKGATMTNSHCGTCGDPLFQQDETTFCPSCHGNPDAVEGTDLEAQPIEGDDGADRSTDPDRTEPEASGRSRTAATEPDRPNATGDTAPPAAGGDTASPTTATEGGNETANGESTEPIESRRTARRRDDRRPATDHATATEIEPTPTRRSGSEHGPRNGDLDGAYTSLVETVEKFAAEAAETDDPRYAKQCLEAAREASETIATLR